MPATHGELPLTVWHDGEYWAPYTTYMEDVGERGVRLLAALNKCERFRNIGLLKGSDFTLDVLKRQFRVGILLREFALEMVSAPPKEIMSSLWISLRLELPCSPFMPMYQTVIPSGSDIPCCKGMFGMLMLNTDTMSILNDNSIYEKVAVPLRKAFGLTKPTGMEGVPKFPRLYPLRGTPFRPTRLFQIEYMVMPSDCDMYRVIFHPQMVSVCDKINYAIGADFREEPAVAIYANLAKPVGVGERFEVRVFVELSGNQTRALYLFSTGKGLSGGASAGMPANGNSASARCAMSCFLVYGDPPAALFSEDVSTALLKLPALEEFAASGKVPSPDKNVDLSGCSSV